MNKKVILFILSTIFVTTAYCSPSLDAQLQQAQAGISIVPKSASATPDNLRLQSIHDTAFIYGAQAGRYARWQEIEAGLSKRNQRLSQVFDFSLFYLNSGKLQPPILDTAKSSLVVSPDGSSRTTTDVMYRVRVPSNFVSAPLTWQRILLPDGLMPPATPIQDLLPQNSAEKQLWQQQIAQGWQQGISQANQEFDLRLNALNASYQGMALYTELAMRGMIEPPHVVSSETAVQADSIHLAIGTQEQTITKPAYWVSNPNSWQPIVYDKPFMKGELP